MTLRLTRCLTLGIALACAGCASSGPVKDLAPGEKPALDTVEAGLHMQVERAEKSLKTSGRLQTDPALSAYLESVLCKISPDYCGDLRIYVVNAPAFNATIAPNGAMQIWSGLLLRARNEAELAFVLGHEFAHYLKRHSLQRWEDTRGKTGAMVFVSFATAAAGVGFVGLMANFALLDSIYAYSREMETESDAFGVALMIEAGYDPAAAAAIFARLSEEKDADPETKGKSVFFASHPMTENRVKAIDLMVQKARESGHSGTLGTEAYLSATSRFRTEWLRQELQKRAYARSEAVLDQIAETNVAPGELSFFRGELHRLRGEDDDGDKAIAAYQLALDSGYSSPELHRGLGLVSWSAGRAATAREAFERYLRAAPDAEDRLIIESYLDKLRQEARR